MMKDNKINPPMGTANTGYEYKVEVKPPFGEALVAELKKILEKSRIKKKSERDDADDEHHSAGKTAN